MRDRAMTGARYRWLWIGMTVLLVLGLAAATLVWRARHGTVGETVVTSSSTALGSSARDVVTSGSAESPGAAWQSEGETAGAWVELSWLRAHVLRHVVLVRNPLDEPGVTDGFLSLGDGSFLQVRLSKTSRETVVPISPRSADRLRFTATGVSAGASNVTVSEIVVSTEPAENDVVTDDAPDGDIALSATVTQSAGASDPRALQDGTGAGADWTADPATGAWVQLDWELPRELTSIALVGTPRAVAALRGATLTFGDGAQLPVGAVLPEPDRPTVISFMPRVTTSVRLTIDRVDGLGAVALGELRAYQRGATPPRSPSPAPPGPLRPDDTTCAGPTVPGALVIRCPQTGSVVDRSVTFEVSAVPGYSTVTATVWPADEAEPAGAPVQAAPDPSGAAELTLDLSDAPTGPLTVAFEATGQGRPTMTVHFQLYRRGATGGDVASSVGATGRTLVYAEEFNRPVSLSRSGLGADYTAAKPTHDGEQDFGDAVFADPARFDNVKVVDDRYLRIDVEPLPPGYADPQGWGRTHLGGLLASARAGGSGFSAQYGYFEARMLTPAAPGTWSAFWMLPSDNLVSPKPVVAEIDAVEHYGHEPTSACHSTHQYKDGRNDGIAACGRRFATERAALSWHTYGVSITPTGITFFIDGREVATAPQVEGGGAPMFFMVDLALGGGWPVQLRAVQDRAALYVDYVRVYV